MRALVIALSLTLTAGAAAAQQDPALEAAKPFYDRMKQVERELKTMEPPTTDAERIRRMGKLDQAAHEAADAVAAAKVPPRVADRARELVALRLQPIDAANVDMLERLAPAEGWFSSKVYGPEAAEAALRILSHAPPPVQRRFLPAITAMVDKGEADRALVSSLLSAAR